MFAGEYQITVDGINVLSIFQRDKPLNVFNNILSTTLDPEIKLHTCVNIYANNEPIDFELELIGDTGLMIRWSFMLEILNLKQIYPHLIN